MNGTDTYTTDNRADAEDSVDHLDYEKIRGPETKSHFKISPERAELAIGDVFQGARYWVGESNSRPVSFAQIVRFTPKRAIVVFLPHVILETFNGGSRLSQDGFERTTVEPLTGDGLSRAAQNRVHNRMAWIDARSKDDPGTIKRFKKSDITLAVTGVQDTTFHPWDGKSLISS